MVATGNRMFANDNEMETWRGEKIDRPGTSALGLIEARNLSINT